jgi:chloramphenicol-sensitive protein RarD
MTEPASVAQSAERDRRRTLTGFLYALGAFGMWGFVAPVHFKLLAQVPALEILAQRIVWSCLLALGLIGAGRRWRDLAAALRPRAPLAFLCVSALLVAGNWLVYIWAIGSGHLVEASLGYFINPLVNVVLGIVFLRERLTGVQLAACALAAVGVLVKAVAAGVVPWVALSLGVSFGFYGLIRKTVRVDPVIGFCVETLLLVPLAAAYLAWLAGTATSVFLRGNVRLDVLLVLTGFTTSAPLIWFAAAAQRLKLSTVGLLQYFSPTCLLLLGVFAYGERFTAVDAVAFGAIWTALALYSGHALVASRARRS